MWLVADLFQVLYNSLKAKDRSGVLPVIAFKGTLNLFYLEADHAALYTDQQREVTMTSSTDTKSAYRCTEVEKFQIEWDSQA